MPRQDLHSAARGWVEAGFYVFPCVPNEKRPACANGVLDASSDLAQIDKWWSENPDYNIGVAPALSGMFVVDVDPPLGAEALAKLETDNGQLPTTLTVRTPRGGLHYWFDGDQPSTASKLCEKVDTRGRGGYVLVPPSVVKGNPYVIEKDEAVAPGPEWIASALATSSVAVSGTDVQLDLPGNIGRARDLLRRYVAAGNVAIEGQGGDNKTYQVCCEVLNLGLSVECALDLIDEEWNVHCVPRWQRDDLATKLGNAAQYAQNGAGAWATERVEETFAVAAAKFSQPEKRSRFDPIHISQFQTAFREPEWLIPGVIPKRGLVQFVGKQKSFKTFLVLDLCLGLVTATETFGFKTNDAARVVYCVGENADALALKHVEAYCRHYNIFPDAVPFSIVPAVPKALMPEEALAVIEKCKPLNPTIVVIDTVTRALRGLDENSAKDMGLFSTMCDEIQRELGCCVVAIRHTGKDTTRGGRGSNVLEGDFDTVIEVVRHEKSNFFSARVTEQRNAAEPENPWYFQTQHAANSLVVQSITREDYMKATQLENQFSRQKVGALLRKLGYVGAEAGVSTRVFATAFIEGPASSEQLSAVERTLRRLSKKDGPLEAYQEAGIWFLPAEGKSEED